MIKMKTRYGFPVVNSRNIFRILASLGVKSWSLIENPVSLSDYSKRLLNQEQIEEIKKYSPEIEVLVLKDPRDKPFAGFRPVWKHGDGCGVFTILPGDLIPISAEYRHGSESVSLGLPGGTMNIDDKGKWEDREKCAKREFEEETGILLKKVIPLDAHGTPVSARQMKLASHSFLGVLPKSLVFKKQKLDKNEFLQVILIPLNEWIKLIRLGMVNEGSSIFATFLALLKLGRIEFK